MYKFFIFFSILLWPNIAYSYLGPGLGIGSIFMVFAVIITFVLSLIAILYYPIKILLKKIFQKDKRPVNSSDNK